MVLRICRYTPEILRLHDYTSPSSSHLVSEVHTETSPEWALVVEDRVRS